MPLAAGFGLLDTLTFPELITILVVGLVVLGPDKLPGMARQAGEWLSKFRTMSANLQREVRDVLYEPEMQSLKELGEFAARPRAKLAEYARNAGLDADDGTDGDAAAATPPTLKPIATGPDHPMEVAARKAEAEAEAKAEVTETEATETVDAETVDADAPVEFGEPVVVEPLDPATSHDG